MKCEISWSECAAYLSPSVLDLDVQWLTADMVLLLRSCDVVLSVGNNGERSMTTSRCSLESGNLMVT